MMVMNSTGSTIFPDYYNAMCCNSNTIDNDTPYECGLKINICRMCALYDFIIFGVLSTLMALFGIIGNTISIIVLSQPQMKSSMNYLLINLAISDTTGIIASIFVFGLTRIYNYTGLLFVYKFLVYPKIIIFLYPLVCMLQMTTVYLTLAVTVERYIAVCHPLKVRKFCTYRRARVAVLVIMVSALLYNIPKFWELEIRDETHWKYNVTVYCIVPSETRSNEYYNAVYLHWIHLFVYVPFIYTFPFIALVILNTAIYRQIRRADRDLQKLSRRQRNEIGLTRILMCVVTVFLICNVVPLISHIHKFIEIMPWWLDQFGIFLLITNSSVNFVIYIIYGDKFKATFLRIFCLSRQHRFKRSSKKSQKPIINSISVRLSQ